MSHFSQKYIKGIVGAGGGPDTPPPPTPPTFKPPKLGDLQAISSYDYVENIDLISDGEIDGFVGQNGEYVDNIRLFESIYLEDVVVRQPIDNQSFNTIVSFDLNFIASSFQNKFYSNSQFIETPIANLSDLTGSNDQGISFSVLSGKDKIANSIFQSVRNIENAYSNIQPVDQNDSIFKQLRFLRAQFNFTSQREVLAYLLPDFPEYFSTDYPFLALKISLNANLAPYEYSHSIDDLIVLSDDICNQIYYDLEPTELQNKKILSPKKKINTCFFESSGGNMSAKGDFYIFFYQKNDYVLKNGVDAIINFIKSVKVINTTAKFNYANATFETREGSDLQKPLSLFNKTYLDTQFNSKLRGPFEQGKPVLTLLNKEYTEVDSRYNASSAAANSGLISDLEFKQGTTEFFSVQELNELKTIHSDLFKNESDFVSLTKKLMSGNTLSLGLLSPNPEFTSSSWSIESLTKSGNIIQMVLAGKVNYRFYSNDVKITLSFDKTTKCFKQQIIYTPGSNQFNILATDTIYIKNYINDFSSTNDFNIILITEIGIYHGPFLTLYAPSIGWPLFFRIACRALLERAYANEGSDDFRTAGGTIESYTNWNKNYVKYLSEPGSRITHIILNPNVDQVFASLQITSLQDTAQQNLLLLKADGTKEDVQAGTNVPSIIEFRIETGYQTLTGEEELFVSRLFQVKGLVNSPTSIDVGREENGSVIQQYSRFILGSENIAQPITLPPYVVNKNRFVRVYRTTAESYSSLVRREIYLQKITEIINVPFSYPYSTICGLKLDARTFTSIPSRSYDARFKKVFVPSNYFPLKPNGQDKRYIAGKNLTAFNALPNSSEEKIIYKDNWDGTFKLAWTDNPVWVLFDILINRRYGLGNFVSPSEINYWELYKIGRYCDAVDSNGVFAGVSSADGGLEPRYAFNGVIADKTNVFDSLKSLVACFRGNMFYTNSEINFTNDRLKPIMAFFNNANVKDGIFNYSNERRDLQYNVIEVTYLDRDDLFKQKIEYVEDPDDIKARGILRTTAQTFGITSKAHAKRLGEHIIYSTINEDENVAFVGGLETLLCRPGDLIAVNDEVKTLKRHVGRVLNVDPITNSIYTNVSLKSSDFSSSGLTGEISVLIPTGKLQSEDFYDLAKSPSKLSISEIYQTDLPMRVTFQATGRQVSPSLSYGSNFFIDTGCSGYPLFQDIRVGAPCSITVANTKQQIYKIQSIKELNLNEYEVIASKFDTGKFSEIEKGETGLMQDFFTAFPSSRNTNVSEGSAKSLETKFEYDLKFPRILAFATGNWDLQSDTADLSGRWAGVANANCYNVELITPKFKSIKQTVTGTSAIFEDQVEVGRFTLKVTARNTGSYPNPISATASSTTTVLSYSAPVRNNGIIQGFVINR
jgi:hypothetical protein